VYCCTNLRIVRNEVTVLAERRKPSGAAIDRTVEMPEGLRPFAASQLGEFIWDDPFGMKGIHGLVQLR